MFLLRMYFDKHGNYLEKNYMNGGFNSKPSVDDDLLSLNKLKNYNKDSIIIKEISERDTEIINKIFTCASVNLDVSKNELVFSFTAPDATLEEVRVAQKNLISQACENAINFGFKSSAHGSVEKLYNCTSNDQLTILGNAFAAESKLGGSPVCKDDKFYWHAAGEQFEEWQALECVVLARDMKLFLEQNLFKSKALQAYIDKLTTIEEVQKVTWDTVIPTT